MTEQQVSDYVAGKIRAGRKERGWSTDDLGERCGLTGNMIENIESGRRDPAGDRRRAVTVDELFAISGAFGVGPLELMPGKKRPASAREREKEAKALREILAEDEKRLRELTETVEYVAAQRDEMAEMVEKTAWMLEQLQSGS
jgi:transcriptional regulator with XRE-family HTH domain